VSTTGAAKANRSQRSPGPDRPDADRRPHRRAPKDRANPPSDRTQRRLRTAPAKPPWGTPQPSPRCPRSHCGSCGLWTPLGEALPRIRAGGRSPLLVGGGPHHAEVALEHPGPEEPVEVEGVSGLLVALFEVDRLEGPLSPTAERGQRRSRPSKRGPPRSRDGLRDIRHGLGGRRVTSGVGTLRSGGVGRTRGLGNRIDREEAGIRQRDPLVSILATNPGRLVKMAGAQDLLDLLHVGNPRRPTAASSTSVATCLDLRNPGASSHPADGVRSMPAGDDRVRILETPHHSVPFRRGVSIVHVLDHG